MGVRDRTPRMMARLRAHEADKAMREDAARVVEEWNRRIVEGRPMWSSPSISAALVAGYYWLDVYCPGCGTCRVIDLRTIDRHPEASVASLVLGLRCTWCRGDAPMPRLLGLYREGLAAAIAQQKRK